MSFHGSAKQKPSEPPSSPENEKPENEKQPNPERVERGLRAHRNKAPLWDGDEIRKQLRLYDRGPFLDILAFWMECSADRETVEAFAEKYPDRHIAAMAQISRMAGFSDKKEIDVDVHVHIKALSDSQLEDRLRQKLQKHPEAHADVIEGDAVEVPEPTSNAGEPEPPVELKTSTDPKDRTED